MPITRAELCTLANIDVERFKSLARRGQLPFDSDYNLPAIGRLSSSKEAAHADTYDRQGHKRYAVVEAFKLCLADDLSREGGVALDVAAKIVSNAFGYLNGARHRIKSPNKASDIWMGIVRNYSGRDGRGQDVLGAGHVAGPLTEIIEQAAKWQSLAEDRPDESEFRIILVNVSQAYRRMRARAEDPDLARRVVTEIEGEEAARAEFQ